MKNLFLFFLLLPCCPLCSQNQWTFPDPSAIGKMFITNEHGNTDECTAVILNRNFALSSAHCVDRQYHVDIIVCPAYDQGEIHRDHSCLVAEEVHFYDEGSGPKKDLVLIRLEEKNEIKPVYDSLWQFGTNPIQSSWQYMSYPSWNWKNESTHYNGQNIEKFRIPPMNPLRKEGQLIFNHRNAVPGESGSPLFQEVNGTFYLRGILTGGPNVIFQELDNESIKWLKNKMSIVNQKPKSKNEFLELVIYPNPSTDYINIKADQALGVIHIFDQNGNIVYKGNDTTIDLLNLAAGMYYIHISTANGNIIKQIQKI